MPWRWSTNFDSEVIINLPTEFLVTVANRQKPDIEKAFSKVLEKPMIVKFVLDKPKWKLINRPSIDDCSDEDVPF